MSEERSKRKNNNIVKPRAYTSEKIHLNIRDLESEFYRADLVFHGLDHAVPSYEGRIFINNPEANYDTPIDSEHGYVGSYFVFGHGSCLGDAGHCDVHAESQKFDVIPNPLQPYDLSVIITDKLKELGKTTEDFTITVIPKVVPPPRVGEEEIDLENIVKIDKVTIETYDKEGAIDEEEE
jgi:hypothetical protein